MNYRLLVTLVQEEMRISIFDVFPQHQIWVHSTATHVKNITPHCAASTDPKNVSKGRRIGVNGTQITPAGVHSVDSMIR